MSAAVSILSEATGITPCTALGRLAQHLAASGRQVGADHPLILHPVFAACKAIGLEAIEEVAGRRKVNRQGIRQIGNFHSGTRLQLGGCPHLHTADAAARFDTVEVTLGYAKKLTDVLKHGGGTLRLGFAIDRLL